MKAGPIVVCEFPNGNSEYKSGNTNDKAKKLGNWCRERFKIQNYNDNFMENFLVRCGHDESLCKEKLTQYFFNKKIYPGYLQAGDLTDDEFRNFCKSVYSLYLPGLTEDGCRIYIDKITDDKKLFDVVMIMKYFNMQTDLRYLLDAPDNGDMILFDCNHVNLLNFITFVPYFIKILSLVLKVYPIDLKLLILINTPVIMQTLLNSMKYTFLHRHKHMFYVYTGDADNFLKHISADVLPSDYGGKLSSLQKLRDNLILKLDSERLWFDDTTKEINLVSFDHSCDTFTYGINGTFRDLQID